MAKEMAYVLAIVTNWSKKKYKIILLQKLTQKQQKKQTKGPKKHTKGPKMQKYRLRNLNLQPKKYKIMFWTLTAETHQKHPKNGQKSRQI